MCILKFDGSYFGRALGRTYPWSPILDNVTNYSVNLIPLTFNFFLNFDSLWLFLNFS
jgi:hypothetical protein